MWQASSITLFGAICKMHARQSCRLDGARKRGITLLSENESTKKRPRRIALVRLIERIDKPIRLGAMGEASARVG